MGGVLTRSGIDDNDNAADRTSARRRAYPAFAKVMDAAAGKRK